MRILHVNFSDRAGGGAGIVAYRLHKHLLQYGCDSKFYVRKKTIVDNTIQVGNKLTLIRNKANAQIEKYIKKFLNIEGSLPFGFLPDLNYYEIMKLQPNIINLHWINGSFLSLKTIKKFNVPIVWTLHDVWLFNSVSHFIHSDKSRRIEKYFFGYKQKILALLPHIIFILPSEWLKCRFIESNFIPSPKIIVVPNGIDLKIFQPQSKKECKEYFGLDLDKKVILFGAFGVENNFRKGTDILKPVMKQLNDKYPNSFQVVIFGSKQKKINTDFFYKTIYLGRINTDEDLAKIYSASDIFLLPSRYDNFPTTAIESIACGCPVVGFNIGGVPEIIQHKNNGYIANPFDLYDFLKGIEYCLENNNGLSENARKIAEEKFDINNMLKEYLNIYRKLKGNL